jgi:hypothetical protein
VLGANDAARRVEENEMTRTSKSIVIAIAVAGSVVVVPARAGSEDHSVARRWNESLLEAIRNDFARPTVHARNLFHVSVAMWDAGAAYDDGADAWLVDESIESGDVQADREKAISYAAYRVLSARFASSPGAKESLALFDELMTASPPVGLGYDADDTSTEGDGAAAVGNRIAEAVLAFGLTDGANEKNDYENLHYEPVNPPLVPALPGNPDIIDPNRWQPLALEFYVDQSGNIIVGGYPSALSPEWGIVTPFSLITDDLTIYERDGFDYWVYHDPGPPPYINGPGDAEYKAGFEQVLEFSSVLDPFDGVMIDISPASRGNSTLGTNDGTGYDVNPITGKLYDPQEVPAGDYYRILAEFWADGPDSETPPGHWFTILNYVSDHPDVVKQLGGEGPVLDDLEWDVKTYLAMGGAMHDVAIASWGVKGWYDYIRPVSAIRYMCDRGQCTDPKMPSYHPEGINLKSGVIELVTEETTAPGERHAHLAGSEGKIAAYAWRGPDYITNPDNDTAGVGWILAENWWPYQRPSFVTPPFPGYVSGHSTYSRAAAEVMTLLTGSAFFPGGLGEFPCPQNTFLVFEEGPSVDVTLQWAKYGDAADECSLSRIYGGIHPRADDIPGRLMGAVIGPEAFHHAELYFGGRISCPSDLDGDRDVGVDDLVTVILAWGTDSREADVTLDGIVDVDDLVAVIVSWGGCP